MVTRAADREPNRGEDTYANDGREAAGDEVEEADNSVTNGCEYAGNG